MLEAAAPVAVPLPDRDAVPDEEPEAFDPMTVNIMENISKRILRMWLTRSGAGTAGRGRSRSSGTRRHGRHGRASSRGHHGGHTGVAGDEEGADAALHASAVSLRIFRRTRALVAVGGTLRRLICLGIVGRGHGDARGLASDIAGVA